MAATGDHVGAYDVCEPIGAGGMGEVYRAHDTKLDRDVALKFLPVEVAADPDRLARFKREARILASLNHSNIAQIYGFEESNSTCCIAMELVKGETLQARLADGALPPSEALRIARDIADGLEAAHDKGIVHRDLKPANVMVEPDDHVKVLDFGLAKALDTSTASAAADNSPTRTALTNPGFIVGTAAYMSPEQARGVSADHRTDVFSLGCVLYEMLTGTRAFHGETPRDVLASIVARDADLTRLPGDLHPDIRTLIKRCLEKSVRHRWQAIGDVRIEIERILAAHPTGLRVGDESAKAPAWWRAAAIIATIVAIAAVATLATWTMQATRGDVAHPVRRFSIPLDLVRPVVSPDGQHIAYRWQDRLWIRDLNSDVSREIPGGEARGGYYNDTGYYLTWSPDSQSVAFLANNEIRRASVVGGGSSTMTICTLPASSTANKRVGGMAWSRDGGTIVFSRYGAGIYEVPARGGVPIQIADDDHADDLVIVDTPQGRAILYAVLGSGLHDLMVRTPAGERRRIIALETGWPELLYVPTGHILFRKNPVENPSLWALPFSTTTLTALGDPFMVERSGLGASLADDGTLVYLDNVSRGQQVLAWRDRSGKLLGKATEGHEVIQLARLSPDGGRAVATAIDPGQSGLWIYDVQRFVKTRLLTESQSSGNFVLFGFWSRRGDEIHYSIGDPARGFTESSVRPADGPETPRKLAFPQGFTVVQDATTDGRYVVAGHATDGRANHIWFWRKGDNGNAETVDFSKNTEAEQAMTLSPSGRFIAYTSTVGDRIEVYVRPFPEGPGRWQISTNGGSSPRWSRDGTELFFVEGNTLKRASVSTGAQFSAGATATLFESPLLRGGPAPFARYDVSPDGRKFLTVEYQRDIAQPLVRIVENWLPDFRTRQTK